MQLPILRYHGPVHVIGSETDLQRAVQDIRVERVVGFDTETRPTFRKGRSHAPSLVQIATSRAVYIFPLAQLDCSLALAETLDNPPLIKAGIALTRDLAELKKLYPLTPVTVVELDSIAARHGMEQTGLRNLVALFLKGRVTKGAQKSNWAQAHLSRAQISYAATDAWACRELYLRFEQLGLLTHSPKKPKP